MLQFYKRSSGQTLFWECWVGEEGKFCQHRGTLGKPGEVESEPIDPADESAAWENAKRAAKLDGYIELAADALIPLVVRINNPDTIPGEDENEKAAYLEELVDDCLGWSGNGNCEGYDQIDHSMEVYAEVVDPKIAAQTIQSTLAENELSGGLEIFIDEDDSLRLIWPDSIDRS